MNTVKKCENGWVEVNPCAKVGRDVLIAPRARYSRDRRIARAGCERLGRRARSTRPTSRFMEEEPLARYSVPASPARALKRSRACGSAPQSALDADRWKGVPGDRFLL